MDEPRRSTPFQIFFPVSTKLLVGETGYFSFLNCCDDALMGDTRSNTFCSPFKFLLLGFFSGESGTNSNFSFTSATLVLRLRRIPNVLSESARAKVGLLSFETESSLEVLGLELYRAFRVAFSTACAGDNFNLGFEDGDGASSDSATDSSALSVGNS